MLLYGFVLQLAQRLSPSLLIATFIDRSLVEMAVDIVTWRSLRCQDSTIKKLRSRLKSLESVLHCRVLPGRATLVE